ncbi:MAG: YbbR-like domain-containing protein [Brevefilum sp.]
MRFLPKIIRNLPSLLTALIFAIAVWIFAVTQTDPTETRNYPRPLEMEVIGLASELTIVNDIPNQVNLSLRAPTSILNRLENDANLIEVTLDLSGLEAGVHNLSPQVNINLSPVEVVSINPSSVFVNLDAIVTRTFPIRILTVGNPAIGFENGEPELGEENVTVSGPQSKVDSVEEVMGEISIVDAAENIQRTVNLEAINADGAEVTGISFNPRSIEVTIPVNQRGGYRTVVVKINTTGQIAAGYRLTNIFAMPPTVTVFSSNPARVEDLGGFLETAPINLNGANESMEIRVALQLPEGVNVVGSQNVTVQVELEPIESSISFNNLPIQVEGLEEGLEAVISPQQVDVFLSGPLSLLEKLSPGTLTVIINLSDRDPGTYQLAPQVVLEEEDINVDAILPNTLEVTISEENSNPSTELTPTPTPEP